jgi:catechol-2,3-dioxygenase
MPACESMLGRRPTIDDGHGLFIDRRVGLLSTPFETTNSKGESMPDRIQVRHIAIRSENPDQLSSFYEKAFGLKVVRRNPRGNKSSIYMTDGFMHIAINAAKDDQPNGIWHFGFLVPSLDPINAITPVHQGETAPGRHAENYIIDPQGNRIDVVLDMWPT